MPLHQVSIAHYYLVDDTKIYIATEIDRLNLCLSLHCRMTTVVYLLVVEILICTEVIYRIFERLLV